MKKLTYLIVFLLAISIAHAQTISIDDSNRVSGFVMVKGAMQTFTFYGDSYTIDVGDFDFEHSRATIEMHPQLGTDVAYSDVLLPWDLDGDEVDDLGVTISNMDPNQGSNDKGEVGSAFVRRESLKPISLEETTITTSVKKETTSVAVAAVAEEDGSFSSLGGTTTWIVAGIVVGIIIILFLLKDKLKGAFKRTGGDAGPQELA